MWHYRSHTVFWVCVLIAGTLLVQMNLYLLQLVFRISFHSMNIFDLCHSWLASVGLPYLQMVLDGLIIGTILIGTFLILKQAYLLIQAKSRVARLTDPVLSAKLDRQYTEGRGKLVVVGHDQPIALTMGFLEPRIVLSTGLLRLLDGIELEAVIRHEEYHLQHRHPLRTLLTYLASAILWYLPILKWCHHVYKITCEVLADRYALERTGSAEGLGGALLKLVKVKNKPLSFAHVSFADTSINLRIRHLVDPGTEFPFRLPWKAALISLNMAAAITGLLLAAML